MPRIMTTNDTLFKIFARMNVTQQEFAHLTDSNKHSIHDWLKNKNEMKFSKLEELCKELGIKIEIKLDYIK
jgi:transcriptional regulator with XRE-family HTH domain